MEAHRNGVYSCCPSWLPNRLSSLEEIETAWETEEYKKIKNSIINGTYEFCSETQCPYLMELLTVGKKHTCFIEKSQFNEDNYKYPTNINIAFDRSCNLSCPSCRTDKIMSNENDIVFIDNMIEQISDKFGKHLTLLYLSGSADPFASKSIRKFLLNFDKQKFEKLKRIHLHTNGLLLTEKIWNDLSHIHDIIKTLEISIDSSTKEVYEIIRRDGNWETLLKNLEFISKIKMGNKRVSFVVQDSNYFQMEDFYNLMMKIFNNKVDVFFNKIQNWGTYSNAEFKLKQIWSEEHPEFEKFLEHLKKIHLKFRCIHNMHEIVDKHIVTKKLLF
jgi:MoaA/NifB/PqqE/SkfB family radical SAM enzyme